MLSTGWLTGSHLHGGGVQGPLEWFRKVMVLVQLCWTGDRHDVEKCGSADFEGHLKCRVRD